MNDEITSPGQERADPNDTTGNTQITDITQVVSCAVGQKRQEQQRQQIRKELVREHFDNEPGASSVSPSLGKRLLKLLKFD